MKTKFRLWTDLAVAIVLGAASVITWGFMRTSDRVTLNVRNMEVREVTRKIERQTGRTVIVQSNVVGKVTLKADNLPFEKALEIVGEQTFARVGSIYPLYSTGKSLEKLKTILSGAADSRNGWTNLARAGARLGGPGSRKDDAKTAERVSLNISFEDLAFTAMAFSRFTPARMVVEDGVTKRVSLSVTNAPVQNAVALVANKAGLDWTEIYLLSGGGLGPNWGRGVLARRGDESAEMSEEQQAQREALNEHLLTALPEDERTKRELAADERQKLAQELQSMTPEQRMQAFQAMRQNQPQGGSQRMLERIKSSTPEQRAAQRRQMAQRRATGPQNSIPPVTRN